MPSPIKHQDDQVEIEEIEGKNVVAENQDDQPEEPIVRQAS